MEKDKDTTFLIERLKKSAVIQNAQKDISWIKWVMGLFIAQTRLVIYWHSDTKSSIQGLKNSIETAVERIKSRIQQLEICFNLGLHPPKIAKK